MSFESLGLRAELLSAIAAQGYTDADPDPDRGDPGDFRGVRPAGRRPDRHRQDGGLCPADRAAAE